MTALRRQLPRFAALVLLLWLFVSGVAFAHACTSKVSIECEECCAEMKAMEAWVEPTTVSVAAAQPQLDLPTPVVLAVPAWEPVPGPSSWPQAPPDPGSGHAIPIFFLRLAL